MNINFCLKASAGRHLERPIVSPDGRTAGITNRGGRPHLINQDSFLAIGTPDATLLTVCDGVGGLPHGEIASTMAVKSLEYQFRSPGFSLLKAVRQANQAVYDKSLELTQEQLQPANIPIYYEKEDGTLEVSEFPAPPSSYSFYEGYNIEIGTTLVAALIKNNGLKVASSGDSKALEITRRGRVFIMNEDHNHSALIYRAISSNRFPLYRPEQNEPGNYYEWQRNYFLRNPITASLGTPPEDLQYSTSRPRRIRPVDRVLLASDGLTNSLPYAELVHTLLKFLPVEETVRELFDACLSFMEMGRGDNVTILLHELSATA